MSSPSVGLTSRLIARALKRNKADAKISSNSQALTYSSAAATILTFFFRMRSPNSHGTESCPLQSMLGYITHLTKVFGRC